jgi:hypothetical protein
MSKLNLNAIPTDIACNVMKFMDIHELKSINLTCKNMRNDSETFSRKIKKCNLYELIKKHTCQFCCNSGYNVNGLCSECYLHMCENCFTLRNQMNEFVKVPVNKDDLCYGYIRMCHDYCVFKCHNCKMCDDRYELFLNDNINFKTICVDCFLTLDEEEKKIYDTPKNSEIENDDEYDY